LDFDELPRLAERLSPGILEKARAYAAAQFPDDRVQQTLIILQELLPLSGVEGPAAIIGFAPPYYARAELDQDRDLGFVSMLRAELSDFSMKTGTSIRVRPYFPGISDMSFLAPADSPDQRSFVKRQSPVSDEKELARVSLGCPV
ncbi:MAG: hypothetical protein WC820_05325, partial [Spirochaetales bacterium]